MKEMITAREMSSGFNMMLFTDYPSWYHKLLDSGRLSNEYNIRTKKYICRLDGSRVYAGDSIVREELHGKIVYKLIKTGKQRRYKHEN